MLYVAILWKTGLQLHNLPLWQQTKDVLFFDEATKRYILAIIRGDFDVNETKLMQAAGAWDLRSATEDEIRNDLQSEPGFISPVGFVKRGVNTGHEVVIVGDASLRTVRNMYGGNNAKHKDLLNINIDRDFTVDIEADVALAKAGYLSPDGNPLVEKKGVEVGNIFQLGYHYTNLMHDSEYTDETGHRQNITWVATASASTVLWVRLPRYTTTARASCGQKISHRIKCI